MLWAYDGLSALWLKAVPVSLLPLSYCPYPGRPDLHAWIRAEIGTDWPGGYYLFCSHLRGGADNGHSLLAITVKMELNLAIHKGK
jgi:hypothetical protein